MGKFLKRSIRADAVILESVRSRSWSAGGGVGMELKRKTAESGEFTERKLVKRWSSSGEAEEGEHKELGSNAGGGGGGGGGGSEEAASTDPRMNPTSQEEEEEEEEETEENLASQQEQRQESDSNWIEEGQKREEEQAEEGGLVRATNSRLLRASHSDSCLKSRVRDPIGTTAGHSRSNSASFSHDQSLGLALVTSSSGLQDAREEEEQHFGNLRETEPCYDDNTLVLYEESQPSTISRTKEDEEAQREAPTPGSTSRQLNYPSLVRDCGPGWRHRSGAPTNDELEDFFATVESEKADRERFIEKYNFDVLNDVPLPGRFEWESLQQS